jgi:hypothetical protein
MMDGLTCHETTEKWQSVNRAEWAVLIAVKILEVYQVAEHLTIIINDRPELWFHRSRFAVCPDILRIVKLSKPESGVAFHRFYAVTNTLWRYGWSPEIKPLVKITE